MSAALAVAHEPRHEQWSRTCIRGFDPDAFSEVVRGGQFEHQLLHRGTLDADLERWQADGIGVDRGRYGFGVFVRGGFPPSDVCIGTARCRRGRVWINGARVEPSDLQVYPEGEEINYRADPGASWAVIQVGRSRIERVAGERFGRPLDLPGRFTRNYHGSPGSARCLQRVLDSLAAPSLAGTVDASGENAHVDILVDAVVTRILDALDRDPRKLEVANRRRRRIVVAAQEWMRNNLHAGYDSRSMCEAIGVSERMVQLAFREAVGMSPSRWFTCARLNGARRLLLSRRRPRMTVTDAALQCGFQHLGRFSVQYRALFGERPSETLSRRAS